MRRESAKLVEHWDVADKQSFLPRMGGIVGRWRWCRNFGEEQYRILPPCHCRLVERVGAHVGDGRFASLLPGVGERIEPVRGHGTRKRAHVEGDAGVVREIGHGVRVVGCGGEDHPG